MLDECVHFLVNVVLEFVFCLDGILYMYLRFSDSTVQCDGKSFFNSFLRSLDIYFHVCVFSVNIGLCCCSSDLGTRP